MNKISIIKETLKRKKNRQLRRFFLKLTTGVEWVFRCGAL